MVNRICMSTRRWSASEVKSYFCQIPGITEEKCDVHLFEKGYPTITVPDRPETRGLRDGLSGFFPMIHRDYPIGEPRIYREPSVEEGIRRKIQGVYQFTEDGGIVAPGPEHYDYLRYYIVGLRIRIGIKEVES